MLNKLLLSGLMITILFGCSSIPKEREVKTITVEIKKPALNLPIPSPLNIQHVDIFIIPCKDVEKWCIGYMIEDYEKVSKNMEKLQNYILNQNLIINQYKQYYEND